MPVLPFLRTRPQPSPMFQVMADVIRDQGHQFPQIQRTLVARLVLEGKLSATEGRELLAMIPSSAGHVGAALRDGHHETALA